MSNVGRGWDGLPCCPRKLDGDKRKYESFRRTISGAAQILAEGVLYGHPNGVSPTPYPGCSRGYYCHYEYLELADRNPELHEQKRLEHSEQSAKIGLTLGSGGESFQFIPGLEIDSQGKLTLNTTWDFTTWTANVGMLTIRAAGNLTIDQNLVDDPSVMTILQGMRENFLGHEPCFRR